MASARGANQRRIFAPIGGVLRYIAGVTARQGLESRVQRLLGAFELGATPAHVQGQLVRWAELVVEWNRRVDLTAARSDDELVDLLLADAAAVTRKLHDEDSQRWVDVGSGAGGPGLALAMLRPAAHLTLVEPKAKRVAFLRAVIGELRLPNVVVERKRSEELGAGSFAVAVSRATFPPAEWLTEGARLATAQVWVLVARSEPPSLLGMSLTEEHGYRWPLTGVDRVALRYTHAT